MDTNLHESSKENAAIHEAVSFLRRVIVVLFGIGVSIAISILVMIKGWGLEPKSFWWIIGVGFFGQIFSRIIMEVGISKK